MMLKSFLRARDGNIAMMAGLLMFPMIVAGGMAIDMMRLNEARSALVEAADSGLLAAVRAKMLDESLSQKDAEDIARRYFDANGGTNPDIEIDLFKFIESKGATFELNVDGRIKTTLLGVTGRKWAPLNIESEAKLSPPRDLEIALVLDNTYSMTGDKLTTLKSAADDLAEAVMKDENNTTKMAIAPFSQYVNLGMSRRDATWLDVPDDYSETKTVCKNTYPDKKKSNCRKIKTTCTTTRDGVTTSKPCTKTKCDVEKGEPKKVCKKKTYKHVWHGCAGSRNYPFNVQDRQYHARRAVGLLDIGCPQEITPLTTDKEEIKRNIDSMSVQGDQTYIPAGLTWGYRMLTPDAPFSEGISFEKMKQEGAVKALVLMTDGENTKSAQYPFHNKAKGIDADRIIEELCDEVKSDEIMLYTIAFEVRDKSVQKLLEACATSPESYFNATDADSLSDAFGAIGRSLTELALTK